MAKIIDIHEDDAREFLRIRRELAGWRIISDMTQKQVAEKAGRSESWIYTLEHESNLCNFSTLQAWAGAFDLRVQPLFYFPFLGNLHEIPLDVHTEERLAYSLSRAFDAAEWVRAWAVARLRLERCAQGVSATELSKRLGLHVSAVSSWERDGNDPIVAKLMSLSRALNGGVTFRLIERRDWNLADLPQQ